MADHVLSTRVTLSGGGASGYGSAPVPTADEITNAQAAIDAMTTDIDTLLTADLTVYLVPDSFFTANGWGAPGASKAWGFTPVAGKAFVSNALGLTKQFYTILHEIGHSIDSYKGVVNHAKHATIGALMRPAPDQTVSGWWGRGYRDSPSENFADSIPRAFAGTGDVAKYYTRPIPSSSYAAFRTAVSGGTAPAATTLAANSLAGATNIKVVAVTGFSVGDWLSVAGSEVRQITIVGTTGSGGTGITLATALTSAHSSGDAVVETSEPPPPSSGDIDAVVVRNTPNGQSASYTFTGLDAGTTGTVKMRFFDGTVWGAWSDDVLVSNAGTFAVTQMTATPGTLTPDLGASLVGPATYNGTAVYIIGYAIQVYQNTSGGQVLKWDANVTLSSGTVRRVTPAYGGDPLTWGQSYTVKWYLRVGYLSASGPFFVTSAPPPGQGLATFNFTPLQDTGPTITYSGNPINLSFKIDTLTPTFRLAPASGNIDEAELRIWNEAGTTLLYDSGVLSFSAAGHKDVTVPAARLTWGINVKIDGAVRASGDTDLGNFNDTKFDAHINAQPGAPSPLTLESDTGQVVGPSNDPTTIYKLVGRTDNVWITTDDTPTAVFPYRDLDLDLGYTDPAARREIELLDTSDVDIGASPYVITSSITDDWTIPSSLLTAETQFKTRARYDDDADVRSAFSDFMFIEYSVPPDITDVDPADGDVVTDPTPTFSWTYTSGTKTQAAYQLVLAIDETEIYDSGFTLDPTPSVDVPIGILDTDQTVVYTLTVYDTDGLYDQEIGTFTTTFTAPDALTGLTLTPDTTLDAIVVAWDQSLVDPDEFYAYFVYVKLPGKDFRLAATITEQDTFTYNLYAAAHNRETIVRISESNGFGESEFTEDSATLGGEEGTVDYIPGYNLVRPDQIVDLRYAFASPGDTQTDLEVFTPPRRGEKVVLNWGTGGYEHSLTFFAADREIVDTLRGWKQNGTVSIEKSEYGAVRYVLVTGVTDGDKSAGWEVTATLLEQLPVEF